MEKLSHEASQKELKGQQFDISDWACGGRSIPEGIERYLLVVECEVNEQFEASQKELKDAYTPQGGEWAPAYEASQKELKDFILTVRGAT